MIYTNTNLDIIHDKSPFEGLDGTKYPGNYPKGEIAELILVTESPIPKGKVVSGYHIDSEYNQAWDYREKNAEELQQDIRQSKDTKLAELKSYYNSDAVREIAHGNNMVRVNRNAKDGITELRARLVDNVEVTTAEWYFDDNAVQTFNLSEIVTFNKKIIDADQKFRKLRYDHKTAIEALDDATAIDAYDVKADINGDSWI